MQKHTLENTHNKKSKARVGRGGKRGKTSGRGHKGQKARAGGAGRPELRDIIKKYPKRRGYGKNRARTVVPGRGFQVVNFDRLSEHFESGETVSPRTLLKKELVRRSGGKLPPVKVLSRGELSKKLTFNGVAFSQKARADVEKTGGTITE